MGDDKVDVENVNVPGQVSRVDRRKYDAMRDALMAVMPVGATDALPVKEILAALRPGLPDDLFPQGRTAGWWQKTVQLDLEAKGRIARTGDKPMRIYRTG